MKKYNVINRLAGSGALAIALATQAVAPAAGAERPPGVLRVGMPLVAETLDPARADNAQAFSVMAGIYDTLYVLDPVARPTAKAVRSLDRDPAGTAPECTATALIASSRSLPIG